MFENIYIGKRVLITGHTGFKGSWLSTWLLKLGAQVYGYSLDIPSTPSHFSELAIEKKIVHQFGDIRDIISLKSFISHSKPEIIFHLAAQPIVRRSFSDPTETFSTNIMGVANILEVARVTDCINSVVIITSDKCYENVEWTYGYRETDRLGGEDPYSASKGCTEIVAKSYMRSFFKDDRLYVATVRAGNVIGGGDWADSRLIPDAIKAWAQNGTLTIRNPHSTRPWQHVLEPLSGYLLVGSYLLKKNLNCKNESFNFGPDSKTNKTVEEVLTEMSIYWKNVKWKVESSEINPKEAGLLKLCCDKAQHHLNWFPTLDFQETIEFTMSWYKTFYERTNHKKIFDVTSEQIDKYIEKAQKKDLKWTL